MNTINAGGIEYEIIDDKIQFPLTEPITVKGEEVTKIEIRKPRTKDIGDVVLEELNTLKAFAKLLIKMSDLDYAHAIEIDPGDLTRFGEVFSYFLQQSKLKLTTSI